jgi:prepilin-type N-terminal cleavage/methylation domain-containing protein
MYKGFTLIELLIVVAIIAILAAIAVPNFLEAQVRAKVARVKSDLRTISIGCESYLVDSNTYPRDQDNFIGTNDEYGFRQLSTPIAYLSSSYYNDPFTKPNPPGGNQGNFAPYYQMGSGADPWRRANSSTLEPIQAYVLFSLGPDQLEQTINDDFPWTFAFGAGSHPNGITGTGDLHAIYDPTNGTASLGDIYRFGGEYNSGTWTIGGLPHDQWSVSN